MRNVRVIAGLVVLVTLVLAGYLTLRSFEILRLPALAEAKEIPPGHQEVAWIASDVTFFAMSDAYALAIGTAVSDSSTRSSTVTSAPQPASARSKSSEPRAAP